MINSKWSIMEKEKEKKKERKKINTASFFNPKKTSFTNKDKKTIFLNTNEQN